MTTDPSAPSAAIAVLVGQLRPGAGVRRRQAVLPKRLRGSHHRLLRAFVTDAGPPDAAVVGRLAAELELDPSAALTALVAVDLAQADPATGAISVAYPFSGRPTPTAGPSRHDRQAVRPGGGGDGGRAGLRQPAQPVQPTGGSAMTPTRTSKLISGRRRGIGPVGTTARVVVGGLLLASVTWGHLTRGFHLSAWLLGLVGFPALVLAGQWLRARRTPTPLRATGPVAHALNLAVFLVLYLLEPTSDAALLFYGASMWLAAVRGDAGCEVLAVSNWLLGRDDQIGCALFWPIDQREHRRAPAAERQPGPARGMR